MAPPKIDLLQGTLDLLILRTGHAGAAAPIAGMMRGTPGSVAIPEHDPGPPVHRWVTGTRVTG